MLVREADCEETLENSIIVQVLAFLESFDERVGSAPIRERVRSNFDPK